MERGYKEKAKVIRQKQKVSWKAEAKTPGLPGKFPTKHAKQHKEDPGELCVFMNLLSPCLRASVSRCRKAQRKKLNDSKTQ